MLAFVNTTVSKSDVLAQLQGHYDSDEIVKGQYWRDGRGCGVGCTIHSADHAEYESRFGVPQMLARLEDCIFEGLPNGTAKEWPLRFMGAVKPGSDLSLVGWKFLYWLLTDKTVNPGIDCELVRDAVRQCADVIAPLAKGMSGNDSAAESAAWSAASAACSAAWSAESAAWSAAWSAARSAERSAAWSAESAEWSAARSAAYLQMAAKLIELIEAVPVP